MAVSDVNTAIMVLQQMLPGPSFSVLLDPLVTTTSTNEFLVVAAATQSTRKRRGSPAIKSEDYFESVVPRYSDPTFNFHFRMCRSTFEDLLCKLEPTLCCKIQPAGKKILCFLWLMGNRESFRSVADRFGISKSSLHRNLTHVANSLLILSKEEIQWPKETFEKKAISKEFEKFPGVVGCVDVKVMPPSVLSFVVIFCHTSFLLMKWLSKEALFSSYKRMRAFTFV
uniref:Transposase Helix-turn-helix domain-containing protein n=1 Tax=Eptatretus burgeri TaxID=7764 RepID=A0A8C4WTN8_EPTBU